VPSSNSSGTAGPAAAAIPKSTTLAPVGVTITFAGLMSRCTRPSACAAASAEATSPQIRKTARGGSGPNATRWARVGPLTSSITTYGRHAPPESDSPKSYTWAMLGCDSVAAARASSRIRARDCGSPANRPASSFTATDRPSTSSRARQTTAMPPLPSSFNSL
jgi:hypothetical protein